MTKIQGSIEEKKQRMTELVDLLNQAGRAYYQEAREIMSNFEYDRLYDELLSLEEELQTTLAASPTVHVGYEVGQRASKRTARASDALFGQDQGGGPSERISGKPDCPAFLENGRAYDCPDLPGRGAF